VEILFVSTELAPYVKVGGLADVAAALPKALRGLGHKVTIIAPRFPEFEAGGLLMARRLTPIEVALGGQKWDVTVFDGRLPSQVDLVLVDVPGFFDRGGVYGKGAEDYPDNAVRFAVLSRAAVEIARSRAQAGQPYDVLHGNDWPAALVPTYKRMAEAETPALAATRVVLTIHNVAHQGVYPKEIVPNLGLGWDLFDMDHLEFYGKANLLKLGIVAADTVTTVSPTYAREIAAASHPASGAPGGSGHGLEGVLAARGPALVGVLNGVDYAVWNPATDASLPARFDAEDLTNKARCRGALQRELGLALDPAVPLVASVGRLVPQKGTDLVAAAIPRLLRATDAQIVVCGDGDPTLVKELEHAAKRSDGRAVFVRAASEQVVHRTFAGADLVLVPSRFEPCGLVQMYAQRYGALPVARATGGIVDTVVDCDAKLETGTGFLFQSDTVDDLVAATERGIAARTSPRWPQLVRRVMRLDRGWERPARQYEQIYRQLK
jgi:starch synthase